MNSQANATDGTIVFRSPHDTKADRQKVEENLIKLFISIVLTGAAVLLIVPPIIMGLR